MYILLACIQIQGCVVKEIYILAGNIYSKDVNI